MRLSHLSQVPTSKFHTEGININVIYSVIIVNTSNYLSDIIPDIFSYH